jgi:hypothetical protein
VLAGNGTLAAMRAMGWTEAQVLRLPWDDPERCRAYAIADNRTAEHATWDADTLADQVGDLSAAGIPMAAFGFEWAKAPSRRRRTATPQPREARPAAPTAARPAASAGASRLARWCRCDRPEDRASQAQRRRRALRSVRREAGKSSRPSCPALRDQGSAGLVSSS